MLEIGTPSISILFLYRLLITKRSPMVDLRVSGLLCYVENVIRIFAIMLLGRKHRSERERERLHLAFTLTRTPAGDECG